jgi:predicted RNA-binding protein with PUA-like domain
MPYFLAKTEPKTYSILDLQRDGQTVWDGVKNPQALKTIRSMKTGDRVFIYHSGGESCITGLAEVASNPRPDPKNAALTVVELRFLMRLETPVTLAQVKQSALFNDWALLRQSRLSTMPVPDSFLLWLRRKFPNLSL